MESAEPERWSGDDSILPDGDSAMHKLAQRKQFEHCSHSWLLALRCSVAPGVDIPGSGCTTIVAGGAMDSVAMAWPGGAESIPHSCNGATAPYQGHVERYREHVIHTRPCAESASADSQPLGELSALSRFRHPRPGREQRKCHQPLSGRSPLASTATSTRGCAAAGWSRNIQLPQLRPPRNAVRAGSGGRAARRWI